MMRFNRFFKYIKNNFGYDTYKLMQYCKKLLRLEIKIRTKIKLIKSSLRYGFIPKHITSQNFDYGVQFFERDSFFKFDKLYNKFSIEILKLELRDAFRHLYWLCDRLHRVIKDLYFSLPTAIADSFLSHQASYLNGIWNMELRRIEKKIEWSRKKEVINIKSNIKPIQYSINKVENSDQSSRFNIHINHEKFPFVTPLNELRNKWFINLSDTEIPNEVRYLLQLGEKFSLPITNNKTEFIVKFIKYIENKISRQNINTKNDIRNKALKIISDFKNNGIKHNDIDKILIKWLSCTKEFVKLNPHLLFTRADKGNTTVVMNHAEYTQKMESMLADTNTYQKIKKDPTNKITKDLSNLLKRWERSEFISKRNYNSLLTTDGILPRAYGVPKIHKVDFPLRIIVSSVNSPLYSLASFLYNVIQKNVKLPNSHIKNSHDLVKKLGGHELNSNFKLISLDVVSLFTNIPIESVINSISNRWDSISKGTAIPKEEFLIAVNYILNSTYFTFNGCVYKQSFGTPMGSPLSPIIADLVLQDLEMEALNNLTFQPSFYFRYVDDIILSAPEEKFEEVLHTFNSFNNRLQFTIEIEQNNQINFLDTTIISIGKNLRFDWFHKPTFSGRYLSFHSQHPVCHKRGVIFGLVDKVFTISHPEFHEKNIEWIIGTLLDNGYPLNFIFNNINTRVKHRIYGNNLNFAINNNSTINNNKKNFFTVPYVKSFSEKFKDIVKEHDYVIAYSVNHPLKQFIKTGKDKLDWMSNCNVVYKINCSDCDASYVGQTKRQLNTRIKEHRNDIKKETLSVVSLHRLQKNHEFKWNNVEILDREPIWNKRLISEMAHIWMQKEGINMQSDTAMLSEAYVPILYSIANIPVPQSSLPNSTRQREGTQSQKVCERSVVSQLISIERERCTEIP